MAEGVLSKSPWRRAMFTLPKQTLRAALPGSLIGCALLTLSTVTGYAQQTTGTPGSPNATTTIDGKYPAPGRSVRRHNQLGFKRLQTVLAGDRSAPEGRAQRLADHD